METDLNRSFGPIGIALAVYRPLPDFFVEQLRSILRQTYPDWLCALTWDSPIAEFEKPEALLEFRRDPRFVWKENSTRLGHKKNFEAAIQAAVHENTWAVACSDQDDVWDDDKLMLLALELREKPAKSLVHSDLRILGQDIGSVWAFEGRSPDLVRPEHLLVKNQVTGCTMLMDAMLARKYPLIPDSSEFHDHWYALAASTEGGVYPLPKALVSYRQHESNVVGAVAAKSPLRRPASADLRSWLDNCVASWTQTRALAQDAVQAGMPLRDPLRTLFTTPKQGSLGLLKLALSEATSDLSLSRETLKRAVGQLTLRLRR